MSGSLDQWTPVPEPEEFEEGCVRCGTAWAQACTPRALVRSRVDSKDHPLLTVIR